MIYHYNIITILSLLLILWQCNLLTVGMFQQVVDQQWIFGKTRNLTEQQVF